MRPFLALALLLTACEKREPEPPFYYYNRTETQPDGTEISVTYSGPKPPLDRVYEQNAACP